MSNEFYNPSGSPGTSAAGSSSSMRSEFVAVQGGFAKLPTMTSKSALPVFVNAGETALEAVSASSARTKLGLGTSAVVDYADDNFTATLTGGTTAPTYNVKVTKIGNQVTIEIPQVSVTSNSAAKTLTGMPAAYRPAGTKQFMCAALDNGGSFVASFGSIASTGVITLNPSLGSTTWTSSGTASVGALSFTYTVN